MLLRTMMLRHNFGLYAYKWTEACSQVMEKIVVEMEEMGGQPRSSEDNWRVYLQDFYENDYAKNEYLVSERDVKYEKELMKLGYGSCWTKVAIKEMVMPEGFHTTTEV
ncbi:uncharacterized protein ARMOST_11658 [Armillaria ostoyae]|uniref:Uncharacterized protein n=1 Tax=Armillaria ostoyae TaxID=47428 RepID=A0A284RHR6_ARMOS|nr:uncharacterized protein ARMOST_11658 [Armillaria ostoyae]